jgi:DNA-binding LytR/AlgR family response regulator
MSGGSAQDIATWRPVGLEPEAPPSRVARQPKTISDLRFTRVDGGLGARLILRIRGRVIVVNEADIDWIDGAGNYIRFHAGGAKHQVRGTLKEVLEMLAGDRFVRVHRSTIINIQSVREFVRTPYGDLIAVLGIGQRLAVGRVYRRNVEAVLSTRL